MNVALPILLLVLGGLTFWLLVESSLKWYLKSACISVFCIFTIIFWSSIHSFLGWPANEDDMPEKVLFHWVIIKEPNDFTKFEGAIYILLESVEEVKTNSLLKFFGYERDGIEPRLYELSYSRDLHEQLEKQIIPRLKKGQPVFGKLTKSKKPPSSLPLGQGKAPNEGEGDGSESQEQSWHFHELLPSEIHRKER